MTDYMMKATPKARQSLRAAAGTKPGYIPSPWSHITAFNSGPLPYWQKKTKVSELRAGGCFYWERTYTHHFAPSSRHAQLTTSWMRKKRLSRLRCRGLLQTACLQRCRRPAGLCLPPYYGQHWKAAERACHHYCVRPRSFGRRWLCLPHLRLDGYAVYEANIH